MFRPGSLRQRLTLCLILPVAILLVIMGFAGFKIASQHLLNQWKQTMILQLEESTHGVDMRLDRAKLWIKLFEETAGEPFSQILQNWIIHEAETQNEIERVILELRDDRAHSPAQHPHMRHPDAAIEKDDRVTMPGAFHARLSRVTPP